MLKTKIFNSTNPLHLEKEINTWLDATPWIQVKNITQSSNPDKLFISIWYEEPDVPILNK